MKLIFIKQKKSQGIFDETGYYFNNEFLNRYKTKAIEILRRRIIDAGNGVFEDGKDKAPKEWKVIHVEYLKSCQKIKQTNETKKPYWDKLHVRTLKNKVNKLCDKITWLAERREDSVKEFNEKIKLIEKEVIQINKQIKMKEQPK